MPFLVGDDAVGIATPIREGGLGHKFEEGPDGSTYFAILGPSVNLVRSMANLQEARIMFLRWAQGKGRDQAAACDLISKELERAVNASGIVTAEFAEETAKNLLERRIVRPETNNPSHLVDSIVARPIALAGGGFGTVGIGDIALLNVHEGWKAQEFGSTHLVGTSVKGYFFGGGPTSFPSPDRRRQNAMFAPSSRGRRMNVENPIKAKRFLTEATFEALAFRSRLWRDIERASVAQTRTTIAGSAGDLAGTPFSNRIGGFASLVRRRR